MGLGSHPLRHDPEPLRAAAFMADFTAMKNNGGKQHGWTTLIWKKKDEKRYIEGKVNIEILQKNCGMDRFFLWDFDVFLGFFDIF